ncbi:hypothetical protein L6452_31213 [Arctium lappa]|uniref:Uncharacterized protein n=1 Tax=Arctium lappa TaxID=4217 RepID=A0ACB8ZKS2_ARCLA|nr:hypothetical protein L6452_31213 [Arctium lappa]
MDPTKYVKGKKEVAEGRKKEFAEGSKKEVVKGSKKEGDWLGARGRKKDGKRFARFLDVKDAKDLEKDLDAIWFKNLKLGVNIDKYGRKTKKKVKVSSTKRLNSMVVDPKKLVMQKEVLCLYDEEFLFKDSGWKMIFDKLEFRFYELSVEDRLVCLNIVGISPEVWCKESFIIIAKEWGEVISIEDHSEESYNMAVGMVIILSPFNNLINTRKKIKLDRRGEADGSSVMGVTPAVDMVEASNRGMEKEGRRKVASFKTHNHDLANSDRIEKCV